MSNIMEAIVTIATAIVGLAILSVLVSRRSATSQVIGAAGSAFSGALGVAVSPVTGGNGASFPAMNLGTNLPYEFGSL